ncbi:MAG: FecR family protein [Marinifilaceae bacterium]|nr:FecR family protein [Marinifilaceae bacterium]
MKELRREYQIAQLISKEIIDELSADEVKKLETWKSESKANKELYEIIKRGENRVERNNYAANLNVKLAFGKVRDKIKPQQKIIRLKEWRLRIAAVLVIGVLVGTLYHISTKDLKYESELAASAIEPGSSKAVLQLYNGERLQLENKSIDSIVEKDGTIISNLNGKLSYTSNEDVALQTIYNTVTVPVGGEYQLTLSDGTKVMLNSESEIKFPVQFNQNKRKVWIEGEVFFDVAHNKNKPFLVDVKDVEIEVLGTEFNVEAYNDQKSVVTTLVRGSVKLSKGQESVIIKPDQQAFIFDEGEQFAVKNVTAENYALWKDGVFYFEEADLGTIMQKLERWYGIKVFYMNQTIKMKRFSVEVKRYEEIKDVLNMLARTNKVHFEIKENVITVKN